MAETEPYPVWWSPSLELESLDKVDERLHRVLWPGMDRGLELFAGRDRTKDREYARDCANLMHLSDAGYFAWFNMEIRIQHSELAQCRAIKMLRRARPAQTSHVRNFFRDTDDVNFLPASIALPPSCQRWCEFIDADRDRIALPEFELLPIFEVRSDDEVQFWPKFRYVRLTILGRGDFNADGVDDLLILTRGAEDEVRLETASVFILTRNTPDAVLRVVGAPQHSCPARQCVREDESAGYIWHRVDEKDFIVRFAPAHDTPYPVTWSEDLELPSLDNIDERLEKEFWGGIRLFEGRGDEFDETRAASCRNIRALVGQGFVTWPERQHASDLEKFAQCRVIELLVGARAANEGYLRDIELDQYLARELLVAAGFLPNCTAPCEPSHYATQGETQVRSEKFVGFDLSFKPGINVWTETTKLRVVIAANADFTGDGVDDLLALIGTSDPTRRVVYTSYVCLFTRDAPRAETRLVTGELHPCRES